MLVKQIKGTIHIVKGKKGGVGGCGLGDGGSQLPPPHGGVGQAKGPELEAGMEPSPGTIIGSRYKVQKGALGHTLPAAAVNSSV